jgi:hypothetical protein
MLTGVAQKSVRAPHREVSFELEPRGPLDPIASLAMQPPLTLRRCIGSDPWRCTGVHARMEQFAAAA